MNPPKRALTAAACSTALTGGLLAAAPAAAGIHDSTDIDWQPCPDLEPGQVVDCATIEVPLDYSAPDGQTIEIGLARRQATDPERRIGTILMDPGGPGGSGVAAVSAYNPLTDDLAERFDVVGFDPRGVNTSTEVLCGAEEISEVERIGIPTDQESFEALEAANAALAADCRERTGPLFDHVDNLHTVEDMERIRLALGEGDLNYLGYSYGTLMGQQYAATYPEHVRSMVLDGNMDHSLKSAWEFMGTETAAVEENFISFAQWCESDRSCALYGEDVSEIYSDLKARARSGELTDPETGAPLDFYGLFSYMWSVNSPSAWEDLGLLLEAIQEGQGLTSASLLEEPEPVGNLYFPAWCQDWGIGIADFDEFTELTGKLAAEYPNVEWTYYNEAALTCVGSGIEHTNPRGELEVDDAPPLLFLGNLHDFATVYPWTEAVVEQSGGHLITYEGYGHTVYSGITDCVDGPVDAYFTDLTLPEEDLTCPNLDHPGGSTFPDRTGPHTGPF